MDDYMINNNQNIYKQNIQTCRDPYDSLGPVEWVKKQLEWCEKTENIAGIGLVEQILKLEGKLIGVEVGVCHGVTSELFSQKIPNIKKLYAVDNYPAFVDWDGTRVTEQRQAETMRRCKERLARYPNIEFVYQSSIQFGGKLEDGSIDFVFIDGDHSYDAALKDFQTYWSKIKVGGVFAGHDLNLASVNKALNDFVRESSNITINTVSNNAWYIKK